MKEFLPAVFAFTLLFSPAHAQAPDPPVTGSPTAIGQTTFTANWSASTGAVDYRLDVSVSSDFSTRVAGYDNLTVAGTSQVVTGLSPGTMYYYQVRASNGSGVSSSSSPMALTTVPSTPVATAADQVYPSYFRANWAPSTGANWYLLDVSSDGFSTMLPDYNGIAVVGTSRDIFGLSPSTQYQYRLRASNGYGISPYSNVITVITVPEAPTALAASSITPTGFVANWSSSSGAIDYRLDVSTDNFQSFIAGFQNLTVAGTSQTVSGLPHAVSFQYRVRARNAGGYSVNSNVISFPATQASNITFPVVLSDAMMVNYTNGGATWRLLVAKAGSPVDAFPVDGTNYTPNGTFGSGSEIGSGNFVVWQGSGPATIDNLTPSTTYHFRVFEYTQVGPSAIVSYNVTTAAGNPASRMTMAAEPQSPCGGLTFVETTTTSTYVNIAAGAGNPTGYLLLRKKGSGPSWAGITDGTTYTTGPYGDGEIVYIGPAGFSLQTSLTSNSEYFFSALSYNGSGTSINYNTWYPCSNSFFTLPNAPLAQDATNTSMTFFDANWQAPSGTGSLTYQIDVSDNGFTSVLQNLTSPTTTVRVEGLTPSKDYQYRVRAVNASGPSANSNAITVRTATPPALAVTTAAATTSVPSDFQQSTQTVTVTGGLKPITVVLKHRPIASTTFSSLATGEGTVADTYTATITSAMLDELGVEFYFEATDDFGTVAQSDGHSFLYRVVPSLTTAIPFTANFDGAMESYQMFSIPYILDDKTIASVFAAQGAPDKTKWRLLRYQGGKYLEYPDNITNIDIGKGYWFNTIAKTDIPVGLGSVLQASQSTPFTLPLEKGWNQVGNPFPFSIDWSIVRNLPANAGVGLNSLWTFANGGYVNTTGFKSWSAGFVFSDNGGTLTIPVTSRCTGCRTAAEQLTSQIDDPAWQVPLVLELNGKKQVAAFGMHPEAKDSKDAWDEITVPRFLAYLEMNTEHPEFFAPNFAVDMKPTAARAAWPFKVSASDPSGRATLRWDASVLEGSSSSLALLDVNEGFLIDMKATGEYSFSWTEGKQLKVLFDRDGRMQPGITLLGNAYPNPFSEKVSFPILLEQDQRQVQIHVYDLMGRRIKTITRFKVQAGTATLEWDGQREGGGVIESGIYLYQLVGDQGMLALPKRMLKR